MSIKILLRGNTSLISVPVSEFKNIMGVEYLSRVRCLEGQAAMEKRCRRAYERKKFSPKQLWMGHYYSQEILAERVPDITIAWIGEAIGYGLWTNRDMPAFTYVGEYTGVLRRPYFFKDRSNYYCFNYYISMSYWERNIWSPYLIDAEKEGNFTRYINHSNTPNLGMASAYCAGLLHIIFYTNKFIPKGTQLSYDYGPIYWGKRSKPSPLSNTAAHPF